ncbi:MAG: hypothetical protein QNJ16_19165 [Rhodobacter sp.]|nr:hypothetical protein [Rhodobacter sp.]
MSPQTKKKRARLTALGRLATAARCGPGTATKPFSQWAESSRIRLANYIKQEPVQFGSFDFECCDLVNGLLLLDKTEKDILSSLGAKFPGVPESVFKYVFEEELRNGKTVADALVTNAAYQKALTGNVQAIKILGVKMGWLEPGDGSGDMDDINEVMRVFVKKK